MTNRLIKIAEAEVGYVEKKNLADLEAKAKNAGDNNFTKYAQDLKNAIGAPFVNGVPWCVIFVDWCIYKTYGKEEAKKLLHRWTMSCGELREAFKKAGAYYKDKPKQGDLVIFQKSNGNRHIGLIYKVDANYIYTIEGNTSGKANTVIENGGGVFKKSYIKTYPYIDGYCRPAYPQPIEIAKPVLKRNKVNRIEEVKRLQRNLASLGFAGKDGRGLAVDGSFGVNTEYAVMQFQAKYGLEVDGSYGQNTYAQMVEVISGD